MVLGIDLSGRRAIVTGGGGALGGVIARALSDAGAEIVVVDVAGDRATEAAEAIRASGGTAHPLAVDLTDADAVSAAFARAADELGPVDVLVNGAGGGAVSPFASASAELWRSQMARNLDTVFSATRAVLPGMLERRNGRIISIASIAAVSGGRLVRNATAYATAKAGVIGLCRALAKEEGLSGITVNCVAPGVIDTDMMAGFSAQDKADLAGETPVGRLGAPEEIARTLVFLASPEAGYITGQVIGQSGGLVI